MNFACFVAEARLQIEDLADARRHRALALERPHIPLFNLGLIETKKRGEWSRVTEKDHIRITALWRKFIGFTWNGGDLSG